jgi:imidazolonepropionase-like amidohydrolase
VTVHAYTPRAIRQAVAAGVKCIEHGHLIDEPTAKLLAEKGIWWSLQPLTYDADVFARMPPVSQKKALQVFAGTENAYPYSDTCRTCSSITKVYGAVKHHCPLSLTPGKPRFYVGKFGQHTEVTL